MERTTKKCTFCVRLFPYIFLSCVLLGRVTNKLRRWKDEQKRAIIISCIYCHRQYSILRMRFVYTSLFFEQICQFLVVPFASHPLFSRFLSVSALHVFGDSSTVLFQQWNKLNGFYTRKMLILKTRKKTCEFGQKLKFDAERKESKKGNGKKEMVA